MQNAPESGSALLASINPATTQKIQHVEDLTHELKRLLVHHEIALDEEGLRREVEILERWMESYRRGLAAAHKISESGISWLLQLRDHLKLAVDERQRLESEGGNPPSKEQAEKTDELLKAMHCIDKTLPDIERMFNSAALKEDA